jgi:hypothetical protein
VDELRMENIENVNEDKIDINKIEKLFDHKEHINLKEESKLNDFEWSGIIKNQKIDVSQGTIILDNSINFYNEMKNLNPDFSILSMNNESENRVSNNFNHFFTHLINIYYTLKINLKLNFFS